MGKADSRFAVSSLEDIMKRVLVLAVAIAMMVSSWPVSAAGPAVGRPVARAQATGGIQGTATSSSGQVLSNVPVHVRNLQNGLLAGSTTSSAIGRFSFAGLNPGYYVVEVANQSGPIVGRSQVLAATAGATVTVMVSAFATAGAAFGGSAAQATTPAATHGVRTAVIITTIAAAAGIAAAIAIANNDSSPSR